MESDNPKAANTTQPTRRKEPMPVRFKDARNSARKNPNGTNAAMFAMLSTCLCPLFWNRRAKSSVRLCPEEWGVIPRYRITTAASSTNRPTKTVRPIATAPYTEHFFRIRRITVNANDTPPITAQCPQEICERMPQSMSILPKASSSMGIPYSNAIASLMHPTIYLTSSSFT